MTRRVVVEADGGSRGNPGPAGYGAVVRDPQTGEVLAERSAALGVETNNVAEYRGLIAGLESALEVGTTDVDVRMDSKLVIEQMSGRWQVKNARLRPLAEEASALLAQFAEVTLTWVPRAENAHADRLANEAMDAATTSSRPTPAASRTSAEATPRSWVPPDMSPTRLALLRHGATAHSVEHRFSGRNDLPLTDLGIAQAQWLAKRAEALGEVAVVVSSPLHRARQTADIIASALDEDVIVEDGFIECDFGAWEGLTFAEAQQKWPADVDAWLASLDTPPPDGESFRAVAQRAARARDTLLAQHPGRTVLVVTHVTPIKTLVCEALDAPLTTMFRLHLDAGSMSIVDYYADGQTSVRLFNEASQSDDTRG